MLNELLEGTIFKVIIPLYGILEAGNSWFATYYKHHLNKLLIETLLFNPYLMLTKGYSKQDRSNDYTLRNSDSVNRINKCRGGSSGILSFKSIYLFLYSLDF